MLFMPKSSHDKGLKYVFCKSIFASRQGFSSTTSKCQDYLNHASSACILLKSVAGDTLKAITKNE